MRTKTIVFAVIVVLVLLLVVIYYSQSPKQPVVQSEVTTAQYVCAGPHTITAAYYPGTPAPAPQPGQPPIPTGSVTLTLDDGRALTLQRTLSADGARYANADESIVFWNKGNGITITEGSQQMYLGCMQVASDPGGLPGVYENGTEGFSLRYPTGYTVDANYKYQALGPGKDIAGIKFTIPSTLVTGTNLGSDSYLSVEQIPLIQTQSQAQNSCDAAKFLDQGTVAKTVDENGTTYSVASTTGAGAGNRYEETVYALPGTNPCVAVRYFVHYGILENYPAGTVKAFDQATLLSQFDAIRKTLTILAQ